MNDRDIVILKKIVRYSNEIILTKNRFSLTYEKFLDDFVARNAISMCILQIGELVGKLTQEIRDSYSDMPWKDIRAMRNIAAHNYGEIDFEILWETITNDIPALQEYCEKIIRKCSINKG